MVVVVAVWSHILLHWLEFHFLTSSYNVLLVQYLDLEGGRVASLGFDVE